jgi:hypothetical protein
MIIVTRNEYPQSETLLTKEELVVDSPVIVSCDRLRSNGPVAQRKVKSVRIKTERPVWTGLSRLGESIQLSTVTVLTPATITRLSALYRYEEICQIQQVLRQMLWAISQSRLVPQNSDYRATFVADGIPALKSM